MVLQVATFKKVSYNIGMDWIYGGGSATKSVVRYVAGLTIMDYALVMNTIERVDVYAARCGAVWKMKCIRAERLSSNA